VTTSKPCQWCGDLYDAHRSTAKYCGPPCRLRAHRAAVRPVVSCTVCGSILSRKKKYCGELCRVRAQLARLKQKGAPL
jgi:hypothetical protein